MAFELPTIRPEIPCKKQLINTEYSRGLLKLTNTMGVYDLTVPIGMASGSECGPHIKTMAVFGSYSQVLIKMELK